MLTNGNLYEILTGMEVLKKVVGCGKLVYCLSKNRKLIVDELIHLDEIRKQSKEYNIFDREKKIISEKYSKLDEEGKRIKGIIDENKKEEYEEKVKELTGKYSNEIEEQNKKNEQWMEMLSNDSNLQKDKFYKIKLDDIPEKVRDGLTFEEMNVILFFIDEEK